MRLELDERKVVHERSLFTVFDLLSNIGELADLSFIIFALALKPYNYCLFLFESLHELFTTEQLNTKSFINFLFMYLMRYPKKKASVA